jgi:hypothetical protein
MDPVVGIFQLFSSLYSNWQNRRRKSPVPDVDPEALELGVEFLGFAVRVFQDIALVQGGMEAPAFLGALWSLSATWRGWRDLTDDSRELLVLFMRLRVVAPDELVQASADAANRLIAASQLLPTLGRRGSKKGHEAMNTALGAASEGLADLAEVLRASRPDFVASPAK